MLLSICLGLCAGLAILGGFYASSLQANAGLEAECARLTRELEVEQRVVSCYRDSHRAAPDLRAMRQAEASEKKTTPVPSIVPAWTTK